jgi:hypothetical protein
LRQAALQAGQDINTFKGVAEVLNGTGMDLRAPGNRGIPRYDPERLMQWLRVQKGRHESPEQGPVPVKISGLRDGLQWTVGGPGEVRQCLRPAAGDRPALVGGTDWTEHRSKNDCPRNEKESQRLRPGNYEIPSHASP